MAQAFTREIDDAPPPPPPERPISPHPNRVTRRGARLIEETIGALRAQLSAASDAEVEARLARELRYWLARRASMILTEPGSSPDMVGFGVAATILRRGERLRIRIVGEDEGDPAHGLIAWTAPLARALEGAEPGDRIDFDRGGLREVIGVLSIEAEDT